MPLRGVIYFVGMMVAWIGIPGSIAVMGIGLVASPELLTSGGVIFLISVGSLLIAILVQPAKTCAMCGRGFKEFNPGAMCATCTRKHLWPRQTPGS